MEGIWFDFKFECILIEKWKLSLKNVFYKKKIYYDKFVSIIVKL